MDNVDYNSGKDSDFDTSNEGQEEGDISETVTNGSYSSLLSHVFVHIFFKPICPILTWVMVYYHNI